MSSTTTSSTVSYPTTKEELDELVRKQFTLPLGNLVERYDKIRKTWADLFDGKAVSCSHWGTFIITANDDVYGMGINTNANVLGLTGRHYRREPVDQFVKVEKLSGKRIQEIRVGKVIGAALDNEGRLYWWGQDPTNEEDVRLPQLASDKLKFKIVSCGSSMVTALTQDGQVYMWGRHSETGSPHMMKQLDVGETIVDLSCGKEHLAMVSAAGFVYTWGVGYSGRRGNECFDKYPADKNEFDLVKRMSLDLPCKMVICGPRATICWTTAGELWACGRNATGRGVPGVPNETFYTYVPEKVDLPGQVVTVSAMWGSIWSTSYCASTTEGLYRWGGPYIEKLDPNETFADQLRYWTFPHDVMILIDHNPTTSPYPKFSSDTTDDICISSDVSGRVLAKFDQLNMHLLTVRQHVDLMRNSCLHT